MVEIRRLIGSDIHPAFLDGFSRYQKVSRCYAIENGVFRPYELTYVKEWDLERRRAMTLQLSTCLNSGGAVFAALREGRVVGFSSVMPKLFGSRRQYANLDTLHVAFDARGEGIGKRLFSVACDAAWSFGAEKLYISAHAAEETIAFYRKVGCVPAEEVNQYMAALKPADCQLEYYLLSGI